jgi:hypothetical protein
MGATAEIHLNNEIGPTVEMKGFLRTDPSSSFNLLSTLTMDATQILITLPGATDPKGISANISANDIKMMNPGVCDRIFNSLPIGSLSSQQVLSGQDFKLDCFTYDATDHKLSYTKTPTFDTATIGSLTCPTQSKVVFWNKELGGWGGPDYTQWTDAQLVTGGQVTNVIQARDTSQVIQTTTISDYHQGCFCQANGADVDPDNPMVNVEWCQIFTIGTAKQMVGIMVAENKVVTHGPVFCKPFGPSESFAQGDLLVPQLDGCRPVATDQEAGIVVDSGMPRVRVMSTQLENGMLRCFIN